VQASRTLQELLAHRLIAFPAPKPESRWTFAHANRKDKETLTFEPHVSIIDTLALRPHGSPAEAFGARYIFSSTNPPRP
jgi:hypothetical protein